MSKTDRLIFAGICLFFAFVCGYTFYKSLPNFCANPQGSGNWIVHAAGLC